MITVLRRVVYFILWCVVFLFGISGSNVVWFILSGWALLIALLIKLKKEKFLKFIFADFVAGTTGYSIKQALISGIVVFVIGVIHLLFF